MTGMAGEFDDLPRRNPNGHTPEENARDAARYRWLRASALHVAWNEWVDFAPGYSIVDAEVMDKAIDEAILKANG